MSDLPAANPSPEPEPPGQTRTVVVVVAIFGLLIVGLIAAVVVFALGSGGSSGNDDSSPVALRTVTVTQTETTTRVRTVTRPAASPSSSQPTPKLVQKKITIPGTGTDDGIRFGVTSIRSVSQIPVDRFSHPIVRKPGTRLIRVDVTYRNNTKTGADPFCGGTSITLFDTHRRTFQPDADYTDIADNPICGPKLQPGFSTRAVLAFTIPHGSTPGGVVVWNGENDADFDGSKSSLLFKN